MLSKLAPIRATDIWSQIINKDYKISFEDIKKIVGGQKEYSQEEYDAIIFKLDALNNKEFLKKAYQEAFGINDFIQIQRNQEINKNKKAKPKICSFDSKNVVFFSELVKLTESELKNISITKKDITKILKTAFEQLAIQQKNGRGWSIKEFATVLLKKRKGDIINVAGVPTKLKRNTFSYKISDK